MTAPTSVPAFGDLEELRSAAAASADAAVWAVIEDGADAGTTLRENCGAWERIRLRPRVLRDVSKVETATSVLGTSVPAPIIVGPSGRHGLFHAEGEVATARGAAAAGAIFTLATAASRSLEEAAAAAPGSPGWFQLYITRDRGWTDELLERASGAGYRAVVLTVDVPTVGNRRRTAAAPVAGGPGWANATGRYGEAARYGEPAFAGGLDDSLTFADVEWVSSRTALPLVVKGILRDDDAVACVDAGAKAVVVSNHGGRQLDGAVASADALAEVCDALGGRAEVYVDGGIRRGTDVLKALALGARATLVVRPVLHGLLLAGADGVTAVLAHLQAELRLAMKLAGVRSVGEATRDLLVGGGGRW